MALTALSSKENLLFIGTQVAGIGQPIGSRNPEHSIASMGQAVGHWTGQSILGSLGDFIGAEKFLIFFRNTYQDRYQKYCSGAKLTYTVFI